MLTGQHVSSRVEALQQGLSCGSLLWPHQVCLVEQNDICKLHLQAPPTRLQLLHKSRCCNSHSAACLGILKCAFASVIDSAPLLCAQDKLDVLGRCQAGQLLLLL